VERAVLVGGGELPGLAAVVAIDPDASAEDEARVRAQVQTAIDHANAHAKPTSRIGRLVVTRVAFRSETGLITRNLKLDRSAVVRYFERELMEGPP
jgi:long-subunit acyl-CoA synthetase (AMP-forming)